MSARCPDCGARVDRHARFCQECGARLESARTAVPDAVTVMPEVIHAEPIHHEPISTAEVVASSARWLSMLFAAFVFVVITCAFYAVVVVVYVSLGYEGVATALTLATVLYLTILGLSFLGLRRSVFADREVRAEKHRAAVHAAAPGESVPEPEEAGLLVQLVTFPIRLLGWLFAALVVIVVVCALFALSVVTITSLGGGLVAGLLGGALVVAGAVYSTYLFFDRMGATR